MTKSKKDICNLCEFTRAACLFVAGSIHIFFTILRWFISVPALHPADYIPGICAAVVSVLLTLFLLFYEGFRKRFRAGSLLTCAMMLLFLLSCRANSAINQTNEFQGNLHFLYDTLILLFFLYPLGRYVAKYRNPFLFRLILNIFLLIGTVFMLYALATVSAGKSINFPTGNAIRMQAYSAISRQKTGLELACNSNTTGLVESIAFLSAATLLFLNKTIPGKAFSVFAMLIHYTGLVLSGSRTTLLTTVLGGAVMLFFYFRYAQIGLLAHYRTGKRLLTALAAAIAFILLLTILQNRIIAHFATEEASQEASSAQVSVLAEGGSGPSRLRSFRADLSKGGFYAGKDAEEEAETEQMEDPVVIASQSKVFLELNRLLSGRLGIWLYAVNAITATPETIRYGVTANHIFGSMDKAAGRRLKLYTHNQFLEIALAIGVPGLAAFLLFLIYTIYHAAALFRHRSEDPVSLMPVVFAAVLLLSNMTEATLMFHRFLSSYVFFFLCGWISERGILVRRRDLRRKKRAGQKSPHTA